MHGKTFSCMNDMQRYSQRSVCYLLQNEYQVLIAAHPFAALQDYRVAASATAAAYSCRTCDMSALPPKTPHHAPITMHVPILTILQMSSLRTSPVLSTHGALRTTCKQRKTTERSSLNMQTKILPSHGARGVAFATLDVDG